MASSLVLECIILMSVLVLSRQGAVYFSTGPDIQRLLLREPSSTSRESVLVNGLTHAGAIDYDPLEDRIYWIDQDQRAIKSALSNGSQIQTVTSLDLSDPRGLAVDPIGGNVYVCDKEQQRITIITTDGEHRRVIVWRDMYSPVSVQVDVLKGYLFWLDSGSDSVPPRVERSSLDGMERRVLVNLTSGVYMDLAVDPIQERVYWTTMVNRVSKIESCHYNGTGLTTVREGAALQSAPHALSVWNGTMYWSQLKSTTTPGAIYSLSLSGPERSPTQLYNSSSLSPYDIAISGDGSFLPVSHSCRDNNGGCPKICLPLPSGQPSCVCDSGETYSTRGCSSYYDDVVFVGYDNQLRELVPQGDGSFLDFQFPVQIGNGNVSSVAVYTQSEHYVFWVEYGVDPFQLARLRRATVDVGTNMRTIKDILPLGWMVEPKLIIGRNYLYWVDVALKTIGVTDLNGKFPKILIDSGLQSPRGLVLDRQSRKLYWVNVNASGSYIEYANENGTDRSVLLALQSNSEPFAMTIKEDNSGSTLYWIDRGLSQVRMLTISDSPTEEVKLHLTKEKHYTSIAYHHNLQQMRDCWLLTTHSGEVVRFCDGSEDLDTVFSRLSGKAHAITLTSSEHFGFFSDHTVCDYCKQLCFPDPDSGHKYCSCIEGYHVDGNNCIVNPSYFLVGGVGRVYILNASLPGSHLHSELELPAHDLTEISTHYGSQMIVWLDGNSSCIYRSRIKSYVRRNNPIELVGGPEVVQRVNSSLVGDIDVDWLGQNVYWSVPEDGRIDYASINNGGHLVFMSGLNRPTQLAIDARNRTLYWTGENEQGITTIYKCLLSGCVPEVVQSFDHDSEITVLSLNVNKWLLVWSEHRDNGFNNIYYLELSQDNSSPIKIHSNITSILSLDTFSNYVYILESGEEEQLVKILAQNGLVADTDRLPKGSVYRDIELLGPLAQPGKHVCGRGECSHICAALEDRFECRCPLGMKLDQTGRACVEFITKGEFVFVATKTSVFLGPYDDGEREISRKNLQMVPYSGEDIQYIQYDPVYKELFIADHGKGWIIALDLTTWSQRIIDKPSYHYFNNWTSFQYDYLGGTLYWSFGTNTIEAASRLGGETVNVFHKDGNPRTMFNNVAVDSHRSTLYRIGETLHYSADKDFIIVDLSLGDISRENRYIGQIRRPHSLALGALGNELFWIDLAFKSIRCYNLSSDETEDCVENLEFNSSTILRVSGDYIYWYNDSTQSVMRARTSGKDPQPVLNFAGLRDIYIGERDYLLGGGKPPCFQPEADCEFWCASTNDIKRHHNCLCPLNYRVKDVRKCERLPCKTGERSCDKSNECLQENYFCNGYQDCRDGSDERPYHKSCVCEEDQVECKLKENSEECIQKDTRCDQQNIERCQNSKDWNCLMCGVNETLCADKEKCINLDYVCDGHEDCKDKSDETRLNCSATSPSPSITTHLPSTDNDAAIIATAVCLISATLLVISFLVFLIFKYCRSRTSSKSHHSQNGSAVRLTSSTAMSTSSTVHYGENSDISSYVTNTDITKDTNVSMITDPDLFNKFGLTRHLSDISVETIVTTDPIVSSDPPPSPVTVKSEAILPSIEPSTGFDQETVYLRAPAPSVNLSCYSDFDRFSSVSEQAKHNVRPITISNGKKRIHFHITQEPNYPEYCPPPSEVMSMASNSHCTPPPPPSPVTLRSTIDVIHEQEYTSSSTMV